jgi:hypothetical protein
MTQVVVSDVLITRLPGDEDLAAHRDPGEAVDALERGCPAGLQLPFGSRDPNRYRRRTPMSRDVKVSAPHGKA